MFVLLRATLALTLLLLSALAASAECFHAPVSDYIKHSDRIFRGTVTDIEKHDTHLLITFRVSRVWKGNPGRTTVLHQLTGLDRATWPANPIGLEFLIFARRLSEDEREFIGTKGADVFGVPICKHATSIGHASEFLKRLGKGRTP